MTRRQAILLALKERLRTIKKLDGFTSDAGDFVTIGEPPDVQPDQYPPAAIVITVQDTAPRYEGRGVFIEMPVDIEATVVVEDDEPYITAEGVLGDIITAVELIDDLTIGGLLKSPIEMVSVRTAPREPGSNVVAIVATYRCFYTRMRGQP